MGGIQSERVILVEGDAGEIVPSAKLAAGMHGFVIMVPPGEEGERLLDMLWRITMLYTFTPRMLRRRAFLRKVVEAVWSKESRKDKPARRPARKRGKAAPSPMRDAEEEKDLEIARRVMKDNREALHELAGSVPDIEDIPRRKVKSGITTEVVREVEGTKLRRASLPASREGSKAKKRK